MGVVCDKTQDINSQTQIKLHWTVFYYSVIVTILSENCENTIK